MALIDGQRRSATAVAAVDCRLAAIDEKRFLRLVD
jgi:CRP-like cAMP-binding protein